MWKHGMIKIGSETYKYDAKVYDEPSEDYGIDGGRISKLEVKCQGSVVINYDRGWDIEPETEDAQLALLAVMHQFN